MNNPQQTACMAKGHINNKPMAADSGSTYLAQLEHRVKLDTEGETEDME